MNEKQSGKQEKKLEKKLLDLAKGLEAAGKVFAEVEKLCKAAETAADKAGASGAVKTQVVQHGLVDLLDSSEFVSAAAKDWAKDIRYASNGVDKALAEAKVVDADAAKKAKAEKKARNVAENPAAKAAGK